jgi:hypothetical protein
LKPEKGWRRRFDDPIPLPRGRHLVTLKDAAKHIQKLPETEQQLEEWQAAVEARGAAGAPCPRCNAGVRDGAHVEYGRERRDQHEVRWIARHRGGADRRVGFGGGP